MSSFMKLLDSNGQQISQTRDINFKDLVPSEYKLKLSEQLPILEDGTDQTAESSIEYEYKVSEK